MAQERNFLWKELNVQGKCNSCWWHFLWDLASFFAFTEAPSCHISLEGHHLCRKQLPLSVFHLLFLLSLSRILNLSPAKALLFSELATPVTASPLFFQGPPPHSEMASVTISIITVDVACILLKRSSQLSSQIPGL